MRSFVAFFKKELLESQRSGRLLILGLLFAIFGIMNPAIAKLTPWLFDIFAEEFAESGMVIAEVTVDALTSWAQFFKNIPMALIAFVLIISGSFTKEYESETLVLILTKGISRGKVLLAKTAVMFILWSVGYWLCFGITYAYNEYFWDNGIAVGLFQASLNWWIFGVFVVALTVFFSVVGKSYAAVLLGTGGSVLALYIIGLIPRVTKYIPTSLMNSSALLLGVESYSEHLWTVVIASVAIIALVAVSLPVFNKKQL